MFLGLEILKKNINDKARLVLCKDNPMQGKCDTL